MLPTEKSTSMRIGINDLILLRRRALKISQQELARRSGLSRNQVNRMENSEAACLSCSIKTLNSVFNILGIVLRVGEDEQQKNGNDL